MIKFSSKLTKFYEEMGGLPPTFVRGNENLEGRHIEIDLLIGGCKKIGTFRKK